MPPLSPPTSPSRKELSSIHSNAHNTIELYRQHCLNYGLGSSHNTPSTNQRSSPIWSHQNSIRSSRPIFRRRGNLLKRFRSQAPTFRVYKYLPVTNSVYTHQDQTQALMSLGPVALFTDKTVTSNLPRIEDVALEERMEFKTNRLARPPFNQLTLICMSIQALGKNKVTLNEIYSWVAENFAFYRDAEPAWKVRSISDI